MPHTSALHAVERDAVDEAVSLLFDGRFERDHARFRRALEAEIFDHAADVAGADATRLAYERAKAVHELVKDGKELVEQPFSLFALAEWVPLLDTDLFSILVVHYNLSLGTMRDLGSGRKDLDDQRSRFASLGAFSPYLATELGYGNNLASLQTQARYDHSSKCFLLTTPDAAAFKFMSCTAYSGVCKTAVVFARLIVRDADCGVFPFIVEICDAHGVRPGIQILPCGKRPGQWSDMALTGFSDVAVPMQNWLNGDLGVIDEEGVFRTLVANSRRRFLKAVSRLNPGRICVASAAAGAAKASVYIAIRFSENRRTNVAGRPYGVVADYLSHRRDLCLALAGTLAIVALVNRTQRDFVNAGADGDAGLSIALCKVFSTSEALRIAGICRERCGAQGTFSVNRIADYIPFLDGLVTAEGDNIVLLSSVAAQLLAGGEPERVEPLPQISGRIELPEALAVLDARFASLCREAREEYETAKELGGVFEAWNAVSTQAIGLARLKSVTSAAHELSALAGAARDQKLRVSLTLVAEIFALTELQKHAAFCLVEGVFRTDPTGAIARQIDSACGQLRADMECVISGFMLTPELLRSPIAAPSYLEEFVKAFATGTSIPEELG